MVEVDQFFNELNTSSTNHSHPKHIHSESDLASLASSNNSNRSNTLNQNSGDEKLTSKKSEPTFNRAFLLNSPDQLELVELWKVVPRPNYAADVCYFKFYN